MLFYLATEYPAANAAHNYSYGNDTCADCTGWYLPSQAELVTLQAQSTSSIALGDATFWTKCNAGQGPSAELYWSSTDVGSIFACYSSLGNGSMDIGNANLMMSVRAVRAF